MLEVEIVIALGVAILLGQMTATRVRLAPPIVLLLLGVLMNLVPPLRRVQLPAEIVLMVLLPILLYWDSLNTSVREIRRVLRGVILNGTLLVVFTAAAVAVVAHACGLSWGAAWLIGAAVAPTDATAVSVLGRGLPRRATTVLKAESLINDGAALVVFALAVELATGEEAITWGHAAGMFAVSFLGGAALGLAVGWLIGQVARRMTVPVYINVLMLLTPFLAYLAAETVEASGVLAVVVCGLYFSQISPRHFSARARQIATPFWSMITFLINGALFVLVGAQLPSTVAGLRSDGLWHALWVILAVYATTLVARFVFLHVSIGLIRLLDRRPIQRTMRTTFPERVVNVLAGFRGAVSLAVGLSVPLTLADGSAFPSRDLIVLVVAGVVVLSLVVQGVVFPVAVRWAVRDQPEDDDAGDAAERAWIRTHRELLAVLPELARQNGISDEVLGEFQRRYEQIRRPWEESAGDPEAREVLEERRRQQRRMQLGVLRHKRAAMVRQRDEGLLDDEALAEIMQRLDMEELRLTGPAEIE
ncbi:Na+/H+ antiporter [Rothia kristinae]|uniref:Na+/H+ antiporter n=1 Tax=Rothia kristinae TaxID=37923 RepID=A0A7T4MSA3_9MICC|nr:Na+/H+ antiporter [Rothia kristinae]QQC58524.1 Na+/H+ antiporter [Rothia kristinae]